MELGSEGLLVEAECEVAVPLCVGLSTGGTALWRREGIVVGGRLLARQKPFLTLLWVDDGWPDKGVFLTKAVARPRLDWDHCGIKHDARCVPCVAFQATEAADNREGWAASQECFTLGSGDALVGQQSRLMLAVLRDEHTS